MRAVHEKRRTADNALLPLSVWQSRNLQFHAHWHQEVEILLMRAGRLHVSVNRESRVLGPGEAAVMGSGDIHWYEGDGGDNLSTLLIVHPSIFGQAVWPPNRRFASPFMTAGEEWIADIERLAGVMREAEDAAAAPREAGGQDAPHLRESRLMLARGLVGCICGGAMSRMPPADPSSADEIRRTEQLARLQEILDEAERGAMTDLSLKDLSERVRISYHHLSHLFAVTAGTSYRAFVNGVRLQKAEQLLATTDLPITEIAFQCGFGSLRTFNRAYRQATGRTPSDARVR